MHTLLRAAGPHGPTPSVLCHSGNWSRRLLTALLLVLLAGPAAWAQLTGVKAIPGDYPSLSAAITDLNTAGVGAGGVTFNVAAGYTETAANLTITASGTAGNPIVFQKSGAGANPLITAGVGVNTSSTTDAIIRLSGADYVTFDGIDVAENSANTTAATQMEFGYALYRASATDGCQNNVIRNCVVTLNKTNTATIGIAGLAYTAASTTALAATSTAGANSGNRVYGNVVTNALTGINFAAASATTTANYDQNNEIGVTAGNTIGNFGGTASGWGAGGNYQNGLKISGNTINSTLNYTSATASTPVAASTVTSTLRGIFANTGTSASIDITNNTITLASGATTSQMSGIENGIGSTAASNTVNITGNTLSISYPTATSATVYGVYNTASAATVNLANNTLSGATVGSTSSTTSTMYGVYNSASAGTVNINGNVLQNNTHYGTSGSTYWISGGGPTTLNIGTNQVTGNTRAAITSGTVYCIQTGTSAVSVTNNVVTNNTTTTTGASSSTTYGYYNSSSATPETLTGNTFAGLTVNGTGTATGHTLTGIYSNPATAVVKNINGNTVSGLTLGTAGGSLSGTVTGITSLYGGSATTSFVSRNKIYDLQAYGAAASVSGIVTSTSSAVTVANNLIGNLTAPQATGLNAISGLNVAGTTVNAYFNTIYLSATSSGATFGTSGLFLASTSTTLDARNNIVVNKSTAAGTGGYTVALRRTSGTANTIPANLATTSNNNLYFAGTPSATNLIYVEGTTSTVTNPQQTLAAYKAFLANREAASVTEDVPFLSTTGNAATFLHVSTTTPTQVESGGAAVAGITVDFDGDTRNASTPDIGADEGNFQGQDLTGPTLTFTPLGNVSTTTARTLTVTIVDASGVATGANAPRLYFRKGTSGAFQFVNATTVSGSSYTFTFDYALVGGVTNGDVVQYYVAAQDLAAAGNSSTNPTGGGGTPPGTTAPNQVYQYTILPVLSGTYYVGTSTSPDPARTYATLTAAANAYNNSGLSGAVTFVLLDAAYSATTGETFPVAFGSNLDASATNTLTIRPNAGVTATITAASSVLALSNARYVTIDGSNNGSNSRNLTLTTTATATGTYNLALISTATTGPGNQFITVKNLNTVGGGVTTSSTYGLYVGNGPDNDNVTLQNNSIQGTYYGIYAFGTANTSAGAMDNLVIASNVVGPGTASASANISLVGIYVASAITPTITGNEVQNITNSSTSANIVGIQLSDVKNGVISRNSVHNISYTGTSTAKVYGLYSSSSTFNTAANASALRFDNNLVYALNSTGTSGSWNTSGITTNGGYGDKYYFNTVYLSGQLSSAAGTAGSAAFSNGNGILTTTTSNIDVRNNIFAIIGGTGGTASTGLYAHYTTATSYAGSVLNNNDLFVTVGSTGAARVGRFNAADAVDLAAWRTATGQEANSVSVNPNFAQVNTVPYDLTPTASALNNNGDATTGITVDYTGATRGAAPDLGAYEFTPATIDVAATALVSPATSGCYGATEAVTVRFTNNATSPLDLALNPVTVTVTVTPPSGPAQTLTTTLNTGTLAPNATQNVTLPGTVNLSAAGAYSFAIAVTTPGDATPGNDQLTATRTVVAPTAQPQLVTFTGFTGSNLTTVFPGWYEATGATLPAGTSAAWTNTSFPAGNTTAKINLFTTGKNDWIVSPKFLATASTVLTFDAGITDYNSNSADPAGMTGTDDFAEVRISTDCGLTFARIPSFGQFNASNQPSNGSLTNYSINLGSYAGQQIILGFFASEGTADDTPDYDFHLDNISVSSPLPIDLAPTALVAPVAAQTCYSTTEAVTVTVQNKGSQALDFAVNPAAISVVVTTPSGSQTLTGTLTTGTLAPNATQNVTLASTLDMSAAGTYSFAITATVQGDQVTGNDVLPAVTRTVAAPVAGTITPSTASICNSGTVTLTLAGFANGTIQWQQSADNVTFTDISGANAATYTTPVLTNTAYFRAQVRCNAAAATSAVATITVATPTVTGSNSPVTVCEGNSATLTATGSTGTTLRYFDAATGGTALGTGASFTTPALTASRQYFVEAVAGGTETVGKTTTTGADGGYSGGNTGLVFNATAPVTIQSVTVFPSSTTAGSMTVELRSSTGTVVATAGPFAVPAGSTTQRNPLVLPINLSVPAAGTYRLVTGTTPTPPELYRDFSGVTYPYTSASGTVSVTGGLLTGNTSTTYYFFYDWRVSSECVSTARTPIQVNVLPTATASLPAATASSCGTAAFQLGGTVGGSATGGTYTTSGTGTFAPNATTLNATYTPSAADVAAGSVTLTLTTTGPCAAATAQVALTLGTPAVATFSYANGTYCAGTTGTIAPALATGATAGTFASTTGLVIDPATGVINLATSAAGTYTVTNTIAATSTCPAVTAQATVTINPAASAAFAYSSGTFCQSGTNPTPTITGTTGGTFTATTGLSINATTGAINLAASTPGTYTVTYTAGTACPASATATVTITTAPIATFSYPTSAAYCAGSMGTVAPALGTGASAGTFSSTTGLTIDPTTGVISLATSVAGTYTVTNTIAASGSCSAATATSTVTITPAASAAFSYAATAYCASATNPTPTVTGTTGGTFSSTTGLSINATTGAINLAASTAGTYTVTYTAGTTCTATATATVTINAVPVRPTVSVQYTTPGVAVLTSSSATGNQWYLNGVLIPGATGATYTANGTAQPGAYTVVVTSAQGCASPASLPLTVTSTSKPLAGSSLTLFPNPTPDGKLTLQLSGYHKAVELTVLNAVGQVVYRHVVPAGTTQQLLDLSQQPVGVYILRAATEGGTDTRRIVRE